jgi:NADH-quinone oxidoreductase subunit F
LRERERQIFVVQGRRESITARQRVVMLLDDTVDLRRILLRIAGFFRHETCSQCVPCRVAVGASGRNAAEIGEPQSVWLNSAGNHLLREMAQDMRDASVRFQQEP